MTPMTDINIALLMRRGGSGDFERYKNENYFTSFTLLKALLNPPSTLI